MRERIRRSSLDERTTERNDSTKNAREDSMIISRFEDARAERIKINAREGSMVIYRCEDDRA